MSRTMVFESLRAVGEGEHRIFELWERGHHYSVIVHRTWASHLYSVLSIGPGGFQQEASLVDFDRAVDVVVRLGQLIAGK